MADIIIDGTIGANRLLLLDSTGKIPAVDGSQVTTIAAGNIATGTIPIARIDTGTTANKIVKLDGNAKLPAVDGSLITNVPGATKNSSDPTISTNPSGGVGTEWQNTTSGEVFVCTDATAGENVWTNVGGHSGDVLPYLYQGTQFGYSHGGETSASGNSNVIEKYSFTANANATDVGDLTAAGAYDAGCHSTTHGYRMGSEGVNVIDKYTFAADANATNVGDMPTRLTNSTFGLTSRLNGYNCGGYVTSPSIATIDEINRISFSTDGNAVDVANLATTRIQASGSTDTVNGYVMCGAHGPTHKVQVDKFVYATEADATDIGDMTTGGYRTGGCSSLTYGYAHGGSHPPTVNTIDKFNFAGSFTATDVGDMVHGAMMGLTGSSSTTYGYYSGGTAPGPAQTNIGKYAFASDGNSTDVADLTRTLQYAAGTSY